MRLEIGDSCFRRLEYLRYHKIMQSISTDVVEHEQPVLSVLCQYRLSRLILERSRRNYGNRTQKNLWQSIFNGLKNSKDVSHDTNCYQDVGYSINARRTIASQ